MKPWCRYDRDFPNDDRVVAMQGRHRAAAYTLLLAMNGYAYRPGATGKLTHLEAEMLADKLGQKAKPLLGQLAAVKLIKYDGRTITIPRFFDWNPELDPDQVARRSEAAKVAAGARWHAVADAESHAAPHAESHAISNAIGNAISMPEIRKRREKGLVNLNPPSPPFSPEATAILLEWAETTARPPSQADIEDAESASTEFQCLRPEQFVEVMRKTDSERRQKGFEPMRYISGYRQQFRYWNDKFRDQGQSNRAESKHG